MKALEDLKELLEDQMKKIAKKGDITPQELEHAYKAVDIIKDIETIDAMRSADEHREEGASYARGDRGGYSGHYPQMFLPNMMYRDQGAYGPVWNQTHDMRGGEGSHDRGGRSYTDGRSYADGRSYDRGSYDGDYSNDGSYDEGSYRRGRDARTGRYVSRDRGYSRAEEKDRMIDKLEDMMDSATSERERKAIQQCVDKLERQ